MIKKIFLFIFFILLFYGNSHGLDIVTVSPRQNENNVELLSRVMIGFDQQVDTKTVNGKNILIYGERVGYYTGSFSYDNITATVIFRSDYPFRVGENITVTVTKRVQTERGESLKRGKSWTFTTETGEAKAEFPYFKELKTGLWPQTVEICDVNGDFYYDVIVANQRSQSISLYLGNGTHEFSTRREFNIAKNINSLSFGDIEQDFDNDVAVSVDTSQISVMFNREDGYFSHKNDYKVGGNPQEICFADLNCDGFLDLQVVNYSDNSISVLMNRGDGKFHEKVDYAVKSEPLSICKGDLDNDWDMDLIVANRHDGYLSLFFNNGDGIFSTRLDYEVGGFPTSIKTADVDSDGNLDIIVAAAGTDFLFILKNDGYGKFSSKDIYQTNSWPREIATSDFDGDGDVDIAVVNYMSNDLILFKNRGDGNFEKHKIYYLGESPRSISCGDIDKDGTIDIAVSIEAENRVLIFWNQK